MQRKIRKYRDSLIIIGRGTIAFGVWSMIKLIMYILSGNSIIENMTDEALADSELDPETFYNTVAAVSVFVLIFIMTIDLAVRIYVGKFAIAVGKGKQTGRYNVFLAWAVFLTAIHAVNIILSTAGILIPGSAAVDPYDLDTYAELFIDITSFVTLAELIHSAVMLRAVMRQAASAPAENSAVPQSGQEIFEQENK